MALKALMLRKQIDTAKRNLEELRNGADFEAREVELRTAIEEAETEEERTAVSEAIDAFETEKKEHEEKTANLESEIRDLEEQLAEEERAQDTEKTAVEEERKVEEMRNDKDMDTRDFYAREDVRAFLSNVRDAMSNKRALSGEGLLVPDVFLGMIRENIMEYSKLYKHVNLRRISGNGREIVMGTIPEAVWTDCCANANELTLAFNEAEVFCWAVGGYLAPCRSTLEDNDVDLAREIVTVLGAAIGLALDKAIIAGLGTRMPLGVVTSLAQTTEPADYPANARPWEDLHTKNITKTDETGAGLFSAILLAASAAKGKYSRGGMVFAMNETTYNYLRAQGLSVNAAGVIVSGVNGTMPVVGGVVEVLDFIADYDIVFGYFDLYLLAERSGVTIEESDHAMFLARRRVYLGTARYDGLPVIREGFGIINVNDTDPTTVYSFAADEANTEASE